MFGMDSATNEHGLDAAANHEGTARAQANEIELLCFDQAWRRARENPAYLKLKKQHQASDG